ncbi:SIMPL domain-containing protein [Halobacillus sp. MO56]
MYHYPMQRNTTEKPWTMKVTGTGMVAAAPDQAVIITGVETENMSLQEAQSANSASIQRIMEALIRAGIPESQIQTSEFRINPVYDFKEGEQVFRGYKVTNLLKITLYDMTVIGSIIDTATANGANIVRGVEFSLQHTDVIYNQALTEALRQAEQKAQTIARSLHATLNALPHSVIESPDSSQPSPFFKATALQAAPTPIEPGQLVIKADVLVSYHYYL